jgi:chemotaxis protein methyltransferase CheR
MALIADAPAMTPAEFRMLAQVVEEHCGLHFQEEMKYLLERRLAPRLAAVGVADFGAYSRFLRYDPSGRAEVALAAELLVTHETYFFREADQLRSFSNELLPLLIEERRATRRLRIWSAGCSSGEEPYTLAMLLLESGQLEGWDATIFGSDLSRRVIAQARRGEYPLSAMRVTSPEMMTRYFTQTSPGRWSVAPRVRDLVSFGQLNLLDPRALALVSRMDVIFCRNVMIYFDVAARKQVLKSFHEKLVEGGFLLLGHSENLINASADFDLVHLQHDLVYRRPRS